MIDDGQKTRRTLDMQRISKPWFAFRLKIWLRLLRIFIVWCCLYQLPCNTFQFRLRGEINYYMKHSILLSALNRSSNWQKCIQLKCDKGFDTKSFDFQQNELQIEMIRIPSDFQSMIHFSWPEIGIVGKHWLLFMKLEFNQTVFSDLIAHFNFYVWKKYPNRAKMFARNW